MPAVPTFSSTFRHTADSPLGARGQACPVEPQYYPPPAAGCAMFDGMVETVELAQGLVLHRVDARDIQGAVIQGVVKPGLRIALVVGGKVEVVIGGRRLLMGPQAAGGLRGA